MSFFKIQHISDIRYLSARLTLLNMIISRSIHVAANGIISFFFLWLSDCICACVFVCVRVCHIPYLFICQWTFRLLLCLDCCKRCCYEHRGICIFLKTILFILGCAWSSGCMGYSLVVVHKLLIVVAFLVTEHRLWGTWASVAAAQGLSSRGSQALEHRLNS